MTTARNAPCPCGSGKKYKKCCLPKDEAAATAQAAAVRRAEETRDQADAATRDLERQLHEGEAERASAPPLDDEAARETHRRRGPDWPPLSADDQQRVDAWWSDVGPVYTGRQAREQCGWLLERTLAFLNEQPRLFRYLYLHEEFLFEIGGALGRAGRFEDHLALLRRLRREQPEMYFECFGYYDEDLLTEALRAGRREDLPVYLRLFRQHPINHIDQFATVVDLLAWRGCETELRALLETTSATIADSPDVIGGNFGLLWLSNLALFPFLEAGDDSPAALDRMWREVVSIGYVNADKPENREWLNRAIQMASPSAAEASLDLRRTPDDWFASDVGWSFTGWLHRTKGLPWASARFSAMALLDYWAWNEEKNKEKNSPNMFGLNAQRLDRYLAQRCRDIIAIKGVTAVSTLQAFHFCTEYFTLRGYVSAAEAAPLQAASARFFETIRGAVDTWDPAYRLYPTYESLMADARGQAVAAPPG